MSKQTATNMQLIKRSDIEVDYEFNIRSRPSAEGEKSKKTEDDKTSLKSLAASIKADGLPPLTVMKQSKKGKPFFLLAGFRRITAIDEILQWGPDADIACTVRDEMDKEGQIVANLRENIQREDLHPAEQAEGFARLVKLGKTGAEVAKLVGLSANHVNNLTRLKRELSPKVWNAWRGGTSGIGLRVLLHEVLPSGDHKAQEARFFNTGSEGSENKPGGSGEGSVGGNTAPAKGPIKTPTAEIERAIQVAREKLRDDDTLTSNQRSMYQNYVSAWEWAIDASKSCPVSLPEKVKGRPGRKAKDAEDTAEA